jgi:hypothetical protein
MVGACELGSYDWVLNAQRGRSSVTPGHPIVLNRPRRATRRHEDTGVSPKHRSLAGLFAIALWLDNHVPKLDGCTVRLTMPCLALSKREKRIINCVSQPWKDGFCPGAYQSKGETQQRQARDRTQAPRY